MEKMCLNKKEMGGAAKKKNYNKSLKNRKQFLMCIRSNRKNIP